jgi:hypothetical protein
VSFSCRENDHISKIKFMKYYLKIVILYFFTTLTTILSGQNTYPPLSIEAHGRTREKNQPTIIIHDTIVSPGEVVLQMDALNFVGNNGQVAAITLHIDIDTNLLTFVGIENTMLPGGWLANYNLQLNEITITYTAASGSGYDIDGKLLDLRFVYYGGFTADLLFKPNCEVSNINLQIIQGVVYQDGSIAQTPAQGTVMMDTVATYLGEQFDMPLDIIGGEYDSVTTIILKIAYDTSKLSYEGFTEYALVGVSVADSMSMLHVYWTDPNNPIDFTTLSTLLVFHFTFTGDSITILEFKPGSKVYNNNLVVASDFIHGFVEIMYFLDLTTNPVGAGVTTGSGYYLPQHEITVCASPGLGYLFQNWSIGDSIVSQDSMFVFTMPYNNVILTANFLPIDYILSLFVFPDNAGQVFGEGLYNYGDSVIVTAIPAEGFEFAFWTSNDSIVSYQPVYEFIMPDSNLSLTANFTIMVYTITAEPNNSNFGTVSGAGQYEHGDTATLTAFPEEGCQFIVWTEDGQAVSYQEIYIFIVVSDRDLIAHFQLISSCPKPVALSVDEITENSATIHWVPSGDEEEWDVLWGLSGFDTITQGVWTRAHYMIFMSGQYAPTASIAGGPVRKVFQLYMWDWSR